MSFIGKRVNIFLILMLMLVLIGFGGVSVYYQYTFKSLNQEYDDVSSNLGLCVQNLTNTTTAFMTAMRNLNSTETDIRKYDTLYEQKAAELENKKKDLSSTQAELTRVTVQREVYKKQIDEAYIQIISLNSTIGRLNNQIYGLESQVNRLNERVTCLRNTNDASEQVSCMT